MITSLVEMLELPNFGFIYFESRNKILLMASWTEIMAPQPLFKNTFI